MDLSIDFSATRTAGQQVQKYAEDFNSLYGEIKNLNEELKSNWKGADADSYTGAITKQAEVMDKFRNSIEEIGKFMVGAANAYEAAQEQNTIR